MYIFLYNYIYIFFTKYNNIVKFSHKCLLRIHARVLQFLDEEIEREQIINQFSCNVKKTY